MSRGGTSVWSHVCFLELLHEGAECSAIKKKDAALKRFHLFGWDFSLRISISRQKLGRIIGSWGTIMHISFTKSFTLLYKDEALYIISLWLKRMFAQAWWTNICQQGPFAPGQCSTGDLQSQERYSFVLHSKSHPRRQSMKHHSPDSPTTGVTGY